jgi:glycosyltransferase involved in cell wall biosynthesis/2-polyprenyl-3-methyl-5-hydroxy-6-metoxy-1,4-benzoquinol methylase
MRRIFSGTPAMRGCTIVARNYLAQAEILARSFKEHHPDCPFAILIIDDWQAGGTREDGVELLNLNDIGLDPGDAYRMAVIYNVTELSTAVKPWLLRRFLNDQTQSVIYFDPDIEIFSPLYDLAELAREHSIVLTPHVTEPIPRDDYRLNETDILGSGIYNLGFIGVGPGSEGFLDWWATRLRRESVIDPTRMRFTDQRWIDFVPGLYRHFIVRDPGFNVAYWNLHSRNLQWENNRYTVNGKPLRFFHYSGYNPNQPHLLSKHQGDKPRVLLSEHPGVARITKEYRKKLKGAGFQEMTRQPYGFESLSNGLKLDDHIRKLYRDTLARFEKGEGPEPPSPFAPEGEQVFVNWLNEPMRPAPPLVTRFMMTIYAARNDLVVAFPDPLGTNAEAFHDWFIRYGQYEARVHEALVPANVAAPSVALRPSGDDAGAKPESPRVNVCGYFRAELGVGEAARLVLAGLEAAHVPYNTVTNDATYNRQTHPFEDQQVTGTESDFNIICVNADQTPVFGQKMGPQFYTGRHTAGVWFWEVEEFPSSFQPAFDYVDEVWVATEFMREALLKVSPKPVFKFHLPIVEPVIDETLSKRQVGLPDDFVFLFSFDFFSVLQRKNPFGVITAFKRAFKNGEGAKLVIKTINGDKRLFDLEKVKVAAMGREDIIVSDGYVSSLEKNTMMARCDCYVSLHRSEGFGLTMAEAMALGRPVIATGYSGNLEFMTPDNSYLCSYEYCQIGGDAAPYSPTAGWAQPNLDEAAVLMRAVYQDYEAALARGRRAAEDIRTLHSPMVAGAAIAERIAAIRTRRARFGNVPSTEIIEQRLEALEQTPRAVLRLSEEAKVRLTRAEEVALDLKRTLESAKEDAEITSARLTALEQDQEKLQSGLQAIQRGVEARFDGLETAAKSLETGLQAIQRGVETRLDGLEAAAKSLERATQQLKSGEERLGKTAESAAEAVKQIQLELRAHAERLARTEVTQVNVQEGLEKRLAVVERHIELANERLPALDASLKTTSERLARISSHIDAVPYMADPALLQTDLPDGSQTIGYRDGGADIARDNLYVSFENIFRGSEKLIRQRQRYYLDALRAHTPVVDIGSGRGEMLDLLRDSGTTAIGVEPDSGMAERARAKGHNVVQATAEDYLSAQEPNSIGAIFCAQVIEHFAYAELLRFLQLTYATLKPGGTLILETVNPHSHRALKTFWVDLTHNKPIFPEVLVALCRQFAYAEAVVQFPCGVGDFENDRVTQGEYAVIATKTHSASRPATASSPSARKSATIRKKRKAAEQPIASSDGV